MVLCSSWVYPEFWLSILSQCGKGEIVFLTFLNLVSLFSLNLQCKFDKHITSCLECFLCVFTLLVMLIEMGSFYEAQILQMTIDTQKKKKCLKYLFQAFWCPQVGVFRIFRITSFKNQMYFTDCVKGKCMKCTEYTLCTVLLISENTTANSRTLDIFSNSAIN